LNQVADRFAAAKLQTTRSLAAKTANDQIKELWAFREDRIAERCAYEGTTTVAIGSGATGMRTGNLTRVI
jgi:nuclear transport factor 2 (NTF2) superfamily protein